jgi:hypothetical protein
MARRAVLVHRGQSVRTADNLTSGRISDAKLTCASPVQVSGDLPPTKTLGFRWTAFDNLFATPGQLAADEWAAARAADEDAAERTMCQFVWCRPYKSEGEQSTILQANVLTTRIAAWTKGLVPTGTIALTVSTDLGKRLLHFKVLAWFVDGSVHVVDYGILEIAGDELGAARGILLALRQLRDEIVLPGFPLEGSNERRIPEQVWIDARYQGGKRGDEAVYAFIRERDTDADRFRPILGFGSGIIGAESYAHPKTTTKTITAIGEGYHFVRDVAAQVTIVEIDANLWKTFFHARLAVELRSPRLPGTLTLYRVASPREHTKIAKHWCAEREETAFIPGKGPQTKWVRRSRNNHWFDTGYVGSAAGHFCGVRLLPPSKPAPATPPPASEPLTTPDGRPYFIRER